MLSDNRVTLNWSDQSNYEDGYIIYKNPSNLSSLYPLDTVAANIQTYTDQVPLDFGTSTFYTIAAYDTNGNISSNISTDIIIIEDALNTTYASNIYINENVGAFSDTVRVNYTTSDPNGSYSTTQDWQYSRDGIVWLDISSDEILENNFTPPGENSILWISNQGVNNLSNIEDESVWFRMRLFNNINISSYQYSQSFIIDNNFVPIAFNIRPILQESSSEVEINLILMIKKMIL